MKNVKKLQKRYGKILINFVNAKDDERAKKVLRGGMKRLKKQWKKIPEELRKEKLDLTLSNINSNARMDLQSVIDDILQHNNLHMNRVMSVYIDSYNMFFSRVVVMSSDGSMSRIPAFSKHTLISDRALLSYNLIKFLRIDEYSEYLHKCSVCSKYFIKLKKSKKTHRCPICAKRSTYTKEKYKIWYENHKEFYKRERRRNKLIKKYMKEGDPEVEAREKARKELSTEKLQNNGELAVGITK